MRRRIDQWLARHSLADYSQLVDRIRVDQDHRDKFTKYLTINTSQFFRDTSVFETIASEVLPAITVRSKQPRIWSAGCSIGAEIYSIAILLAEAGWSAKELFATDLDEVILNRAREGRYTKNEIQNVSPHLIQKYFSDEGSSVSIASSIKRMVTFAKHDLLRDPYPKPFDLILCRNVFIYFTPETQQRLIHNFVQALVPGGYFVVGSAEHIMDPGKFGLERVSYCIYSKS